ncbi:glycosyltransferase family 4 protein [uncultured Winogradskyella sp.]|uniref:glycosyltransferase family 4 protein n=1 Tax=uncultured Winogradskyella sp. TaxID=395353 RepID=UPI00261B22AB|nr:glycosyltransferase family 4 protein [uncultured Winogradskyella sp.]
MKEKPKILVLAQLPPPVHGVSVINKNIIDSSLINSEFDLVIVPLSFVKKIKEIGRPSLAKVWSLIATFIKLFKVLISKKIDLVYFTISPTGYAFYRDIFFVLLLKLFKKKIVYHLHGKGIKENSEKSKVNKFFYEWVFKNTKVIILSDLLNYDIEGIYKSESYILNNGIENVKFEKQVIPEIITFVFLSNLMESKGIKIFLEAIKITFEKKYNFKVKIIGNISQDLSLDDLNVFVKENNLIDTVEILGPQYGKDKYNQLAQSDVFVFPTLNDCFPLSIIEAMQMWLPVISTSVGAIPEIIEREVNGQIVPLNSGKDVSDEMINYIENTDLIKEHGFNNYTKFNQKYTQEKFEENFIKVINQIFKDFN